MCLKSLSNRQKNLLVFALGFVVRMAAFWGVMRNLFRNRDLRCEYDRELFGYRYL